MTTASNTTTISLDMTNPGQPCVDCGSRKPTDERGRCRFCAEEISTDTAEVAPLMARAIVAAEQGVHVSEVAIVDATVEVAPSALAAIAAESASNASVHGIGTQRGPGATMRGVGFSNAAGYIQAIRNGVPSHTHRSYLTTLRAQYQMTSADLAALNLPGPMAETSLPVGAGVVHAPANHTEGSAGIFDRPAAQRAFVVGPSQEQVEQSPRIQLEHGKLVAGAASEGHGVLVGWRGMGQLTRGALKMALDEIGQGALLPAPMSARAQAGNVLAKYNNLGMVVRVARKAMGSTWVARWTIGAVKSANRAGESYGDIVLAVELLPSGELHFDGDEAMAASIKADYDQRIAAEVFQAGDVTSWLSGKLYDQYKAVSFGIGYFVHQRHAAAAETLCKAVAGTSWGHGWVLPALPIADSSQLRDGIVRGLTEEVADLMARLATEREIAKTERKGGDIGAKRAGTYLKALRDIGQRIVAFGQVIGEERVVAARDVVRAAVVELETLLGDDFSGIGQRFSLIWDEIERDQSKAGGTL